MFHPSLVPDDEMGRCWLDKVFDIMADLAIIQGVLNARAAHAIVFHALSVIERFVLQPPLLANLLALCPILGKEFVVPVSVGERSIAKFILFGEVRYMQRHQPRLGFLVILCVFVSVGGSGILIPDFDPSGLSVLATATSKLLCPEAFPGDPDDAFA